jgi:hypothetical protein
MRPNFYRGVDLNIIEKALQKGKYVYVRKRNETLKFCGGKHFTEDPGSYLNNLPYYSINCDKGDFAYIYNVESMFYFLKY